MNAKEKGKVWDTSCLSLCFAAAQQLPAMSPGIIANLLKNIVALANLESHYPLDKE